jgi:hypothetical protein
LRGMSGFRAASAAAVELARPAKASEPNPAPVARRKSRREFGKLDRFAEKFTIQNTVDSPA